MDFQAQREKEPLLESTICFYLSAVDDANALGEIEVVSKAHSFIKKEEFNTETEYYTALTEYIIDNL